MSKNILTDPVDYLLNVSGAIIMSMLIVLIGVCLRITHVLCKCCVIIIHSHMYCQKIEFLHGYESLDYRIAHSLLDVLFVVTRGRDCRDARHV